MIRSLLVVSLLAVSLSQLGQGGLIQAKAWLGQLLMERAWAATEPSSPVKPWPGAVSHPVARLSVPTLAIDRLVLEGAETPVLAWGPGMEVGPNGHQLIAAHRDTHFRFLQRLERGDQLLLEWPGGSIQRWQVIDLAVVDSRRTAIDMGLSQELLSLVTCYPFDAGRPGGPMRYVVSLRPAAGSAGEREDFETDALTWSAP
jgi:sortase A